MLAQRGTKAFAQKPARTEPRDKPVSASSRPAGNANASKKLSFKQKFALEKLPGEMQAASSKMTALETKMADPQFYVRDPDGFARSASTLDALRADLARMEEEWLELEMLREEIEG